MSKVIVFGSLNMDMSIQCDGIPRKGETTFGHEFICTPGGKGANQAVAASRMGAETYMVGKVGSDAFGRELMASLTAHGVSCMNVTVTSRDETGTALVIRAADDSRIIVDRGANGKISYDEVRAAIHGLGHKGNIFLAQGECDHEVTMNALLCAKRNGLFNILNASPATEIPDEVYAVIDLICVNALECETLTGILPSDDESCTKALAFFAEKGVGSAVITLGKAGSVTTGEDGSLVRVAAYPVETVDSTGAGDAYLGELAAHLSFDGTLIEGMRYASAAAALCVTKVGSLEAIPSWAEVESFVNVHGGISA